MCVQFIYYLNISFVRSGLLSLLLFRVAHKRLCLINWNGSFQLLFKNRTHTFGSFQYHVVLLTVVRRNQTKRFFISFRLCHTAHTDTHTHTPSVCVRQSLIYSHANYIQFSHYCLSTAGPTTTTISFNSIFLSQIISNWERRRGTSICEEEIKKRQNQYCAPRSWW